VLRATTDELKWVIGIFVVLFMLWAFLRKGGNLARMAMLGAGAVLLALLYLLEAKVWGVGLMGASVLIFAFLPWLDRSPVKSIRYKGWMYKLALAIFVFSFLVLGYLGMLTPTNTLTRVAQVFTLLYFAFFLLMPWYTSIDKTTTPPERLT
jgi:ubiquinol-cytochrome c reductase cytochrome b subunit